MKNANRYSHADRFERRYSPDLMFAIVLIIVMLGPVGCDSQKSSNGRADDLRRSFAAALPEDKKQDVDAAIAEKRQWYPEFLQDSGASDAAPKTAVEKLEVLRDYGLKSLSFDFGIEDPITEKNADALLLKLQNAKVEWRKAISQSLLNTPPNRDELQFVEDRVFGENSLFAVLKNEERMQLVRALEHGKQISLGMNRFEQDYKQFPNFDGTKNRGGLSWRVWLLPYVGHKDLFDQFHLEEPWDSEHNLPLLEKIPAVYATGIADKLGFTTIQVVAFENGLFGSSPPRRFDHIQDGSERIWITICCGEEKATEWTRPNAIEFDPQAGTSQFGEPPFDFGYLIGMLDLTQRSLGKSVDSAMISKLVNIADGQPTTEELEATFPTIAPTKLDALLQALDSGQ